jgi:Xaa-Pro aminopeptidase
MEIPRLAAFGLFELHPSEEVGFDDLVGSGLAVDGKLPTSELLEAAINAAFVEHGTSADEFIVSHGAQCAIGHEMGSGPIRPGEPIVIDLWPRVAASAGSRTSCSSPRTAPRT